METHQVHTPRSIESLVSGLATSDGAGVKLTRVLTQDLQRRLDPFLMLDHFASDTPGDYIGGFPNHPHRGFETVTYMVAGRLRHKDSAGNEGLLENGGVQWMTAGRGLIHSEMPEQEEGLMEGFQLWLNLPASDKMCKPWYRDIQSHEIPELIANDDVRVRVIAGHSHGLEGAITREHTRPLYIDLLLPPGATFSQVLPPDFNAFIYVYRENLLIDHQRITRQKMAVFRNDPQADGLILQAPSDNAGPARALLIAGRPLNEAIAQYGPFVMNTQAQLMQAVEDFNTGKLA